MTNDERLRFLNVYNGAPPLTDANPEAIVMFWANQYQVMVVFVENGCVTHTGILLRPLVDSIISPNVKSRERPFNPMDREA